LSCGVVGGSQAVLISQIRFTADFRAELYRACASYVEPQSCRRC